MRLETRDVTASSALGACLRHPPRPAAFRCRQCTDAGCFECRAAGERDLCAICAEYWQTVDRIEAQGGLEAVDDARPRARWGRRTIVGLVAVDVVALAAFLLLSPGSAPAPEVAVSPALRDAAAVVSSFVERDRDESGRYPASLDTVVDRVSPEVAAMVREGSITYWTSPDSLQYEVGVSPPARPTGAEARDR